MVCAKLNKMETCSEALIQSVIKYPYNWCAWVELANTIHHNENVILMHGQEFDDFIVGFFGHSTSTRFHDDVFSYSYWE